MSEPDRKYRMTRPQLFGESRAAAQARRAAGCCYEHDLGREFEESATPITRLKSVRKLVRSGARARGARPSWLGKITKAFRAYADACLKEQ